MVVLDVNKHQMLQLLFEQQTTTWCIVSLEIEFNVLS